MQGAIAQHLWTKGRQNARQNLALASTQFPCGKSVGGAGFRRDNKGVAHERPEGNLAVGPDLFAHFLCPQQKQITLKNGLLPDRCKSPACFHIIQCRLKNRANPVSYDGPHGMNALKIRG